MKRYITAALLFAAAVVAACQFPSASVSGIEDSKRSAKGRGFFIPAGAILVMANGEMYGSQNAIDRLHHINNTGGNVVGITQTRLPDGTVVTQTTTTERTPGGGYVNTTVTKTDNGTTTTTVTDKTTVDSEGNVSQKTDSDTTTSQGGNQIYDPFDGEPEGSSTTTTTGTGKSPEEIKTEITTVTRYYDDGTKLEVQTETWTDLDGVIHTVVTKIYYDADGKEIFRETATILETANADGSTTITAQIIRPPVFEAPDGSGTRFLLGTDGHLYILADPAADYYIRRVSIAGIHDVGNRQERTRHAQMLQEVDQLGRLTGISVIYNNGLETPGPFVPEIRLPVRYDPDPEDSTKMVVIPYASAELWLKHLPGGVETESCTWQLAGSLGADDLQLYAVGAPLKIFGSVPLPANAAAGDEFILLLRLVDADGNASGEEITAGSNLPVITPPDKTVIVVGQDSDQLSGTGYSNSYVFRVKYSGRKALR